MLCHTPNGLVYVVQQQPPQQPAGSVPDQQQLLQLQLLQQQQLQQQQLQLQLNALNFAAAGGLLVQPALLPAVPQPLVAATAPAPVVTLPSLASDGGGSTHSQGESDTQSESATSMTQQQGTVLSPVLRASGSTPVQGLAGAASKRIRNGQVPAIEAMGPMPVAMALRAIVLAQSFLQQEGIQVVTSSCFIAAPSRTPEPGSPEAPHKPHPGLRFTLSKGQCDIPDEVEREVLVITGDSVVGKTAGAAAKMVRYAATRGGCAPFVCASFGPSPDAINVAAKALTVARAMLADDGIDISLVPIVPPSVAGDRIPPAEMTLTFLLKTTSK